MVMFSQCLGFFKAPSQSRWHIFLLQAALCALLMIGHFEQVNADIGAMQTSLNAAPTIPFWVEKPTAVIQTDFDSPVTSTTSSILVEPAASPASITATEPIMKPALDLAKATSQPTKLDTKPFQVPISPPKQSLPPITEPKQPGVDGEAEQATKEEQAEIGKPARATEAPPGAPPAPPRGSIFTNAKPNFIPIAKAPPTQAPIQKLRSFEIANIFQDQKVISLGQAAKLMHPLIKESLDLEMRCELYLELIKQRNSRTETGVINLVRDSSKRPERPDLATLNLRDKLQAELAYGALGKVRIFQASLDDEFAEFVDQDMEEVKNDLFDCVAHAADRHQRAISNVNEFVADTIESIEPLVYDSRHALNRIQGAKQAVEHVEMSRFDKTDRRGEWLEAFKILFVMIINNRYKLTQDVMGFMTTQDTLEILDYMVETNDKIENFKNNLVHRESHLLNKNKSLQKSREYKDELLEMFIVTSQNLDWLPKRSVSFTQQRTRWSIISNTLSPFNGLSIRDVTWLPGPVVHREAFEALVKSCPFYSDYFEHTIRNMNIRNNSLKPETARWLIERLNPFSLACRSPDADRNRLPRVRSWFIFSILQRVQRWCLIRLNDPSLPDEDKLVALSIMRMIP